MRRKGYLGEFVHVYLQSDSCYISADGGRVCRPLIICDRGTPRVTQEHIEKLRRGACSHVSVCMPVCTCVCVCVCVCVREREREREGERESVYVCVRECVRERECVCVCEGGGGEGEEESVRVCLCLRVNSNL